jgi:hypothetical protein
VTGDSPAPAATDNVKPRAEKFRVVPQLLSVAALVLTVFLFTPARIYLGNFMEFASLFPESMLVFLAASLAAIVALLAVVLLLSLSRAAGRIAVSVLCGLAVLAWLQGNILVWDYGVLDGRGIDWNALSRRGIIDVLAWAGVLSFAVVGSRLVYRASRWVCLVLVVVQLASVGQLWIAMPKDQGFKQQQGATDTLFRYSDHVNVIVMVIDTFQSDLFPDIIRRHPDLETAFDGFTYFRNALTGSDGTIVSVPNMLTGEDYDNSVPYLEWVKTVFLGNSLPKTLREYGFTVDLFPLLGYTVHTDFSGLPFGRQKLRDWRAFAREQVFLGDLALFRCAPQPLKRLVYNRQHWFLAVLLEEYFDRHDAGGVPRQGETGSTAASTLKYAKELENMQILVNKNRDPRFIMDMIGQSEVMRGQDAFKFIHLKGLHLPLIMDEDLDYVEMEPYRDNMLRQGAGMLKIAATFLERLERLGVYDDSLVFIVGDHGSGVVDAKIAPTPYGDRFNRGGPYPGNFQSFKAAGVPLVLVKRLRARGALATSLSPVALGDIPRTVAEELGLEADFPGRSMFAVAEGEPRERMYRAFIGPQLDVEYLAPLWEYAVDGDSWDDTSWRETGNVYYAPKE